MIARHVIARLLETFFSRWWLYLLPVVALTGVGVYTAGTKADTYRSSAVLSADAEPLLSDFQDVARTDILNWETPAQATARRINEALRTEAFVQAVATGAGIPDNSTVVTLYDVRESIWASDNGQNLLTVNASTFDPQLAHNLVQSTITTFTGAVVDDQIRNGEATKAYLVGQIDELQQQYDDAVALLNAYVRAHPEPFEGDRSVEEELEIGRLSRNIERADTGLADLRDDIQAAELLIEQATSDATQTIKVVDSATIPVVAETGLRSVVMTVGTFAILGILLMLGAVVGASLLDRSLRFAEEVRNSLGVEVLAVVPVEPRGRGRLGRKAPA